MDKLRILFKDLYGKLLILAYKSGILRPAFGINKEQRTEKVIISLTSYGRRVKKVLPYTICSLLRQSLKPDMILLWLDNEHWCEENLPEELCRLQKYGLTIRFCEDLKSYKKLIPTLNQFPNDIIITCDDDVFYKKDTIKQLIDAHQVRPHSIICHIAHYITLDSEGHICPYGNWVESAIDCSGKRVFPVGVGGCLYKKEMLHSDVCRQDLFMQLAPFADDIWFYFMAHINGTDRYVLPHKGQNFILLDAIYQKFNKNSNLSSINVTQLQNDTQFQAIMNYYHISAKDIE